MIFNKTVDALFMKLKMIRFEYNQTMRISDFHKLTWCKTSFEVVVVVVVFLLLLLLFFSNVHL